MSMHHTPPKSVSTSSGMGYVKCISYLSFRLCCRYYDLDVYHRNKIEKVMKKGFKKVVETERTVFNDEEQRRYVLPLQHTFILVIL